MVVAGFEMVMVVVRDAWEDEFEPDFDDNDRDKDADIRF